jgi:hypothetical protein
MLHVPLSKPHAGPTTVLVDEFYTGIFKCGLKSVDRPFLKCFAAFKSRNCVYRHFGRGGEFAHTDPKGGPCHPTLDKINHNLVTISFDITGFDYHNHVMIS